MAKRERVTGLRAEPVSNNSVQISNDMEGLTRVVKPVDNAVTPVIASVDICKRVKVDMHVAMGRGHHKGLGSPVCNPIIVQRC